MIFLNEKDGPDERDEIDLLTGSGGEDGWRGAVTGPYSLSVASHHHRRFILINPKSIEN